MPVRPARRPQGRPEARPSGADIWALRVVRLEMRIGRGAEGFAADGAEAQLIEAFSQEILSFGP